METKRFNVEGMTCAACQVHVEKAVKRIDGVKEVNVNLLTNTMDVTYEANVTPQIINNAVDKAGYHSSLPEEKVKIENKDNKDLGTKKLVRRLSLSLILLIPLFILSMSYMMNWFDGLNNYSLTVGFIEFILATIILYINRNFFISGFKSSIHGSPNMDALVSLGSGVAYIYSLIIFIAMTINYNNYDILHKLSMNIFFETSGMVPTLITIGKTLESVSKGKTTNAIKALINLAPKKANVIRNGKEMNIDLNEVVVDDTLIIRPGEAVPVDGIITKGSSTIDESMLTGESIPVDKNIGNNISQGTINMLGTIEARAVKVGNDTSLANIIKLVEAASSSKAKISRLADRVAGIFTPIVIAISLIVFTIWLILGLNGINYSQDETVLSYAIARAISVLVISCPCALGLATPVAIMVGSGKGAKNGILFKSAESIEETGKAKFIVLDKTGTITNGNPEIRNVIPYEINKDLLYKYAVSIETKSSHPLAKAICNDYNGDLFDVVNFNTLIGSGVEGYIDNKKIIGVNAKYALEKGLLSNEQNTKIEELSSCGETPMVFAYNNKVIGIISVVDKPKEDSKKAISYLKKLGIIPVMLTGDNELTARSIAGEVGIDNFVANVKPEEKQIYVKKLKELGNVIMVGDGINDAIALTEANIGMAIGTGTDVAIESADVILMKSSLMDSYKAIRLSQKTLLNIKENLFWAFFYNLIMIPIAAGLFSSLNFNMKPWYGAAAMSLSSVCVCLNALRLNAVNISKEKKKKLTNFDSSSYLKVSNEEYHKLVIKVNDMMCSNCVEHIESTVSKLSNVVSVKANLDTKNVIIKYKSKLDKKVLFDKIKEEGYSPEDINENKTISIFVDGMMCSNCTSHVEKACKKVTNVIDAKASIDNKNVVITYNGKISTEDIINNIKEAGYTAKEDK